MHSEVNSNRTAIIFPADDTSQYTEQRGSRGSMISILDERCGRSLIAFSSACLLRCVQLVAVAVGVWDAAGDVVVAAALLAGQGNWNVS